MILVDINEPEEIIKLLKQSCPVVVSQLNMLHMSDYWFANYSGETFQFSRKQAPELLGDIDEAEAQVADYFEKADHNFQIVEGLIDDMPFKDIPVKDRTIKKISTRPQPTIFGYKMKPDRSLEGNAFDTIHTISILHAWVHRLAMSGVVTYWTANWIQTAKLLSAIYHNEQKPPEEHHTLKRVIRPKLHVPRDTDPFIKALLFLSSAYRLDIGEKRARALFERFANLMDLMLADVDEVASVEGIGKVTAEKTLKALGRDIK